jgi:hypothetical protein
MLASMPAEKLLDYLFLQVRNLWRVDGLYFLGVENEFGTEAARTIDEGVWEAMAAIEAKSLLRMFQIRENPGLPKIMQLLQRSSWALDQPFKIVKTGKDRAVLEVKRCRTQETRVNKGLSEFPCKQVRFGYLKNFAKTLNPKAEVKCVVCPPDKHAKDSWCKWEFTV